MDITNIGSSILTPIESLTLHSASIGTDINNRLEKIDNNFNVILQSNYLRGAKGDDVYMKPINLGSESLKIANAIVKDTRINSESILDYITGTAVGIFVEDWVDGYKSEKMVASLPYVYMDKRAYENLNDTENHLDLSCMVYYDMYDKENDGWKTLKSIPSIYYNEEKGTFCWQIQNQKTDLIAQGPAGSQGKNGSSLLLAKANEVGEDLSFIEISAYYSISVDTTSEQAAWVEPENLDTSLAQDGSLVMVGVPNKSTKNVNQTPYTWYMGILRIIDGKHMAILPYDNDVYITDLSYIIGNVAGYVMQSELDRIIKEELITKNDLSGIIEDDLIEKNIDIKYKELVKLAQGGSLKPGAKYRITDFVTTCTHTCARSAGHQFDIIVEALNVNTLSENVKAIIHEGDTYFQNSKLEAWELKYCLSNDTSRFDWADTTNGKGVIYYMKDEHNNEAPYDFKNIQFDCSINSGGEDGSESKKLWMVLNSMMISPSTEIQTYLYTFSLIKFEDNELIVDDFSINRNNCCANNSIGCNSETTSKFKYKLQKNIFINKTNTVSVPEGTGIYDFYPQCCSNKLSEGCSDNYFGHCTKNNLLNTNCSNNYFWTRCRNNTLGCGCKGNIFKTSCHDNNFLNACTDNTLGIRCFGNIFGSVCTKNQFGQDCNMNTFESGCDENTFEQSCHYNTFGSKCSLNTFESTCNYNTFGSTCSSNTFGINCTNNVLENSCLNNTFDKQCVNNRLNIKCSHNEFDDSCKDNILGQNCSQNKLNKFCCNNKFENNCQENELGSQCNTNAFGVDCKKCGIFPHISSESIPDTLTPFAAHNVFDCGCYNVKLASMTWVFSKYCTEPNKEVDKGDFQNEEIDVYYISEQEFGYFGNHVHKNSSNLLFMPRNNITKPEEDIKGEVYVRPEHVTDDLEWVIPNIVTVSNVEIYPYTNIEGTYTKLLEGGELAWYAWINTSWQSKDYTPLFQLFYVRSEDGSNKGFCQMRVMLTHYNNATSEPSTYKVLFYNLKDSYGGREIPTSYNPSQFNSQFREPWIYYMHNSDKNGIVTWMAHDFNYKT